MHLGRRTVIAGVGLFLAGHAAVAEASCRAPEAAIVWSSPAAGATDVPTNAHVVVLTSVWQHQPAAIQVNGTAVARAALPFSYAPTLQPNTLYVVNMPVAATDSTQSLSFSFTTGAGPSATDAPGVPVVTGVERSASRDFTSMCRRAHEAVDCFDTGQDTHAILKTAARPLFWILEPLPIVAGETPSPTLWPGECGEPSLYVQGIAPAAVCRRPMRLHAVSATGQSNSTELGCSVLTSGAPGSAPTAMSPPVNVPSAPSEAGGCSLASGSPAPSSAWSAWFILLSILGLRSRKA
jgi:hypothetical protein